MHIVRALASHEIGGDAKKKKKNSECWHSTRKTELILKLKEEDEKQKEWKKKNLKKTILMNK